MDNFGKGAIVIALIIEGFILYGGLTHPTPITMRELVLASLLPASLIATVVVIWFLQKGET